VRNNPLRYIDPTGYYLLQAGEPGTPTEFAVRETPEGVVILHGGVLFPTAQHVATANYVLTGDPRYLRRIPEQVGPWTTAVLVDVFTALGYTYRSWRGQVWREVGAVLAGGLVGIKVPLESPDDWLAYVPARYREAVARAFEGTPEVITLTEDLIVYRHWGGDARETGSPWFSPKPYIRPGNARRYLALPPENTAKNVSVFRIPAGTTIIRGKVAPQIEQYGPYAAGGGMQIYLPNPEDAILLGPLDVVGK